MTPRQSLLTALLRLSETEDEGSKTYSSLNERELFIFDLEQILKVLTFKEVCLLVFPCLEIFAVEQEYLKIDTLHNMDTTGWMLVSRTDADNTPWQENGEFLLQMQGVYDLVLNSTTFNSVCG